jgi:hypothetical protein
MDKAVGPDSPHEQRRGAGIEEVRAMPAHTAQLGLSRVCNSVHLIAAVGQLTCEVAADEPARAGDKNAGHVNIWLT